MAALSSRAIIPVDYEDMKTGFQSGKAAAMSDWSFRKEQAEFGVLLNRLRARKWAKENPGRANENAKRFQRKPGIRQRIVARAKAKRHARHRKEAVVLTCPGPACGVQFCRAFPKKGLPRIFCTNACKCRARYHRVTPGAKPRERA